MIGSIFCLAALNRPIFGALLFSLAISIKIGALLLLPCLLGWIQYSHGTLTLLASFMTIISLQIIMAAPFLMQTASLSMGWPGANSTPYMYLIRSKIIPSTLKARRLGACQENSVWWNFIDEELYKKGSWLNFLQMVILSINIYYFFIRRNCLPRCLSQLFNTFPFLTN